MARSREFGHNRAVLQGKYLNVGQVIQFFPWGENPCSSWTSENYMNLIPDRDGRWGTGNVHFQQLPVLKGAGFAHGKEQR